MIPLLPRRRIAPSLVLDFLSGVLDSRISFSRASSGFSFDATGTLQQALANTARFDWNPATLAPLGLLMEGQRTNSLRNPRAEGAVTGVIGSGAVAPTYWSLNVGVNGVTTSIVGTGTESGLPYIDVAFSGTNSGATFYPGGLFEIAGALSAAASQGQTWTASVFARVVAGTLPASLYLTHYTVNSSGSIIGGGNDAGHSATTAGLAAQRFTYTRAVSEVGTAGVIAGWFALVPAGATTNFTIRIGVPQLERGVFASSPILPPVGTPATATRADDNAFIADVSSMVTPAAGAFAADFDGILTDGTVNNGVIELDNGSSANCIRVFGGNGTAAVFQAQAGGVGSWYRIQSFTANARNTCAATWSAASGRYSANGAGVANDSGALPAPAPRLLLGCGPDGSIVPLFGHLRRVQTWPAFLPPEQLLAEQSS